MPDAWLEVCRYRDEKSIAAFLSLVAAAAAEKSSSPGGNARAKRPSPASERKPPSRG